MKNKSLNLISNDVSSVNQPRRLHKTQQVLQIFAVTNLYILNIFLIINFIDQLYALQSCQFGKSV